jgi:tetratricopeptide (TPR) repeat protein
LVEGYFALKPLGPTKVKGVSEPVNVYEVTGLGPLRSRLERAAGRGFTKFVGRQREMDAMKEAAEQAQAGHGQIVAAMAEAGVGKSRLIFEFKATSATGWMVIEAFSVSHGKASSYLPVIDLLHSYFKIASQDDQRTRREKIAGRIAILDRTLESATPYLYSLLGIAEASDPIAQMDAQTRRRGTLDAIKRILLRESLNQPLMVIFEDLHWIDEGTQALLNLLADSIGTAKLLLLVNYRPEYSHQWNSKTYYTQLRLDPLGKESADEMLSALLGDNKDLAPLKRLIIERTEGNPFFMEETVQVLLDEGALVRNGTVKLTKALGELKIPPTVQAILASRIDRLPADAKELLQTLAVIGREFPISLIGAVVTKSDDELNRLLNDLQLGEFIYEQPAVGDTEYVFKHALTREVAYNSVLMERRKMLHERTGAALEELYGNRIDDRLADLARHFSRGKSAEKAVEYLRRAAEHAISRSGYVEAEWGLSEALQTLASLPSGSDRDRAEIAIQTALASLYSLTKGSTAPEVDRAVSRAAELCRQGQEPVERMFTVLSSLWGHLELRGELARLRELTDEILTLAHASNDPAYIAHADYRSGVLAYWQCDLRNALTKVRMAIQTDETRQDKGMESIDRVGERVYAGWILHFMGYPQQSQAMVDAALSVALEYDSKLSLVAAYDGLAFTGMLRGDPTATMNFANRILSETSELPAWFTYGTYYRGWAQASLGESDVGVAAMQRAIGWLDAVGERMDMPRFLSSIAEALGKAGRFDEALETIAQAMNALQNRGRNLEPELYRIQGELLIQRDPEEAEVWLRKAIESSVRHEAKFLELHASTSLARLLKQTRRREEARAMLADIYNWFTEGFDTADLKDAKALLDELGT